MPPNFNVGFAAVLVFGTLLTYWQRKRRKRNVVCPQCARRGHSSDYGKVVCSSCGAEFLLDQSERPDKSLLLAWVGELMIYVYAAGLLAYDCIEYGRWYTGAAILIPLAVALWRFRSLRRPKKFFTDDHAA